MPRPAAFCLVVGLLLSGGALAQDGPLLGDRAPTGDEDAPTSLALAALGVFVPIWGPIEVLHDSYQGTAAFPRRPYAGGQPGYLWLDRPVLEPDAPTPPPPPGLKWWALRLSVEEGNDFSHVNRLGGEVRLDTQSRVGVLAHWNWYRESFPCGCTADFFVGDVNLTYRFAQHERAQFYAGIGCRVLADSYLARDGLNLVYGFDLFPVQPLVISGLVDGGTLGSLGVIHTRCGLGLVQKGWELLAGYDFLRIGLTDLQGPFLGLRLWY